MALEIGVQNHRIRDMVLTHLNNYPACGDQSSTFDLNGSIIEEV